MSDLSFTLHKLLQEDLCCLQARKLETTKGLDEEWHIPMACKVILCSLQKSASSTQNDGQVRFSPSLWALRFSSSSP